MTRTQIPAIAIAFSTLFAGQAMAADNGPATRAQVKAELAEAIANGDMIFNEAGVRYNEFFPHNYPAKQVESKTRAEVKAELAQAIANGDMVFNEAGVRYNEFFPHNYAATDVDSKSRAEVKAELAEAIAEGTYPSNISA